MLSHPTERRKTFAPSGIARLTVTTPSKRDRQIVAIAKVEPVSAFYSTDKDVHAHAKLMGVPCFHLADLPLPPEKPQMELNYGTSVKADPDPE
jgi:hypothetical protein